MGYFELDQPLADPLEAWHTGCMPKRKRQAKRSKLPRDINQRAHELVRLSTQEATQVSVSDAEIKRVMAELGSRGGKKGGKRRAERMLPEERSDAAARAANARWHPRQRS